MKKLSARAPAKLILSGEHAVLYGAPAIAMAIDTYAHTYITYQEARNIFFDLINLNYSKALSYKALKELNSELQNNYNKFLDNKYSVSDILKKPSELVQYTIGNLINHFNLKISQGINIKTVSDIPCGCGMGSSAAVILSSLFALGNLLNLNINKQNYYLLGLASENLQHGKSSGLDMNLILNGGCLYFKDGKTSTRNIPDISMQLINTGTPQSSTGECVSHVKKHFEKNKIIVNDFTAVTEFLDKALSNNDLDDIKEAIKENNKLLASINVVSSKTLDFIENIEKQGGAAKICGAGTVTGDNSGVVLVVNEKSSETSTESFEDLINKYKYSKRSISGVNDGIKVFSD